MAPENPPAARDVQHVLAAVGANIFLQAAFAALRDRDNLRAASEPPLPAEEHNRRGRKPAVARS